MQLNERKRRVLEAIVEDYIASCEPVGSRSVARRYDLGVSPATIRNEMADLEEAGLLEQPHTSAGRVPSDIGYRFYVDQLMEQPRLEQLDQRRIQARFAQTMEAVESMVRLTAQVLSQTTDCLSLVGTPRLEQAVLRSLQVVSLQGTRGMLILVTDDGLIEHRMIALPPGVNEENLNHISYSLTQHLGGRPLEDLQRTVLAEMRRDLSAYGDLLERLLEILAGDEEAEEGVYMGGTANILKQPEFQDVEALTELLDTLERQETARELLAAQEDGEEVQVTIGQEISHEPMQECSIITTTYRIEGRVAGRIGVLGPKRMDYGRMVALVDFVSRHLSDTLDTPPV